MSLQKLEKLIVPSLSSLGYECVRIRLSGGRKTDRAALQVMAEPVEGREMTVDDCAAISRHLAAVLDVEDPIDQAYTLEISSPGIDRPLTREADFNRFAGEQIKITLLEMREGQKRFKGRLSGMDKDGTIHVETTTGRISFRFSELDTAKLDPSEFYSRLKQSPRRNKPGKSTTD